MLQNFVDVAQQVLLLCLLMGVGFLCGKVNFIDIRGESCLATLTLYVSMPSVVITSFQRSFQPALWNGFLLTLLVTAAAYAGSIALAHLTIRGPERGKRNTLRFAAVFSNCGFMSLPLAQTLYGDEGVFYSAAIVALFNLMIWTYGYKLMGDGEKPLPPAKLLLNPGLLALAAGLFFFFTSITLPAPVGGALKHMASLNTPLGMFVIGSRLSRADLRQLFGRGRVWLAAAERLLVIPLMMIAALALLDVRGIAAMCCLIAACAPAASATTMFAVRFGHDEGLAANVVSSQTLLSAATMPLVVALAQTLLL